MKKQLRLKRKYLEEEEDNAIVDQRLQTVLKAHLVHPAKQVNLVTTANPVSLDNPEQRQKELKFQKVEDALHAQLVHPDLLDHLDRLVAPDRMDNQAILELVVEMDNLDLQVLLVMLVLLVAQDNLEALDRPVLLELKEKVKLDPKDPLDHPDLLEDLVIMDKPEDKDLLDHPALPDHLVDLEALVNPVKLAKMVKRENLVEMVNIVLAHHVLVKLK